MLRQNGYQHGKRKPAMTDIVKHETLVQCWFIIGPPSEMLAQQKTLLNQRIVFAGVSWQQCCSLLNYLCVS